MPICYYGVKTREKHVNDFDNLIECPSYKVFLSFVPNNKLIQVTIEKVYILIEVAL